MKNIIAPLLMAAMLAFAANPAEAQAQPSPEIRGFGQNFLKADGRARTLTILLFDGMTAQDFIGIYTVLNFVGGQDLDVRFVAKKKGLVHDERGRLKIHADYSIDEIEKTDLFVVPGGNHFGVVKDKKMLRWVKKLYDSSEYTASICTGSIILGAAGATTGLKAGTAWPMRDQLAKLGVEYVPTPPPSRDGKYYSAAGATAGIEIGLILLEQLTGNRALSEVSELAAEWNPQMLYGSGDPAKAPPHVLENFSTWMKSDPLFNQGK